MQIQIKTTGSGTKEQIIEALQALIVSLTDFGYEANKATWEDETLCTDVSVIE